MTDDELRRVYDEAARNRFAKFIEAENMPPPPEVNAACFAAAVRAVFEAGARGQQNEYICKCGLRVAPHRCEIGSDF